MEERLGETGLFPLGDNSEFSLELGDEAEVTGTRGQARTGKRDKEKE